MNEQPWQSLLGFKLHYVNGPYDTAFERAEMTVRRRSEMSTATPLCVLRMSALVECFKDRLSPEHVEAGTAFVVQILIQQAAVLCEPTWRACYGAARSLASKRPSGKLTREELLQIRDAVLFPAFGLSVSVTGDILARKE